MSENWPFDDPENLAVFTLKRIVRGETPVLQIFHNEDDGGWQFLDEGDIATVDASLVSLRSTSGSTSSTRPTPTATATTRH